MKLSMICIINCTADS